MTSKAGESSRRGFTLVELLAVVAIVGIMAGGAIVGLRGLRSPALASSANEVASALKMTRQMAVGSGRKMYFVVPTTAVPALGATNLFRSYAIFEEVRPGEDISISTGSFTNSGSRSIFIPRTDWRTLPEGVIFCNLVASGNYSTAAGDPFTGYTLGEFFVPALGRAPAGGQEWKFFESFKEFDVRRSDQPNNPLATNRTAFLAFSPSGRASYEGAGVALSASLMQGAAIRLAVGLVKSNQIAITDTNNYYYVETETMTGRVRVRGKDSYRE